jgi:hypothetical protein
MPEFDQTQPAKRRWRILDIADSAWRSRWCGWLLLAGFALLGLWWWWHIPSTGKAGMLLAVAAAIMSARGENLKGIAMGLWILTLFGLLGVEYRAIDKDKRDTTNVLALAFAGVAAQANTNLGTTLQQATINLKTMLDDEHQNFSTVLQTQRSGFVKTLNQIVQNDQNENQRFGGILFQQQQLFQRQTDFLAFLRGRLLPADDPTPPNGCNHVWSGDDVAVFVGDNVGITNKFPPQRGWN